VTAIDYTDTKHSKPNIQNYVISCLKLVDSFILQMNLSKQALQVQGIHNNGLVDTQRSNRPNFQVINAEENHYDQCVI